MQMKYVVIYGLAIVVMILILIKKEYRTKIICGYLLCVIGLNIVYNFRVLPLIAPFYHPYNQSFYQMEFLENGEFPDAFVPMVVNGKSIITPNDPLTIDESTAEGRDWLYAYYHITNITNYMKLNKADVINDESLNGIYVKEENQKDFYDLGYANDMFRYTFLCNDFWEELGNYFTYYWYYYENLSEMHFYINPEGMDAAEELVLLWDNSNGKENEDYYLMTKDYFEREVVK